MENPYGQFNDHGYCQCSNNPSLKDPGCGRVFAGLTSFDAHMKSYHCLSDEDLLSAGFYRDKRGWWHMGAIDEVAISA